LFSINKQYIKHYNYAAKNKEKNKTHLYIKEFNKSSIELQLVIASSLQYLGDFNNITSFITKMKQFFSWILTKKGEFMQINASDIHDFMNIVKPAISGNGNVYMNINGDVNAPISISIPNADAQTIYGNCSNELEEYGNDSFEIHNNVLLRLIQIKNDINDKKNTKGIIEEIKKKEISVGLPTNIRNEIMNINDNPFLYLYFVNVKYYKKENRYLVIDLLDKSIIEDEKSDGLYLDQNE